MCALTGNLHFNFIGYNYFEGGWGGIGVRYAF
jgi:hypothetical protein